MSWKALITDAGNELSAKTISGGNIKLTHAKAGSIRTRFTFTNRACKCKTDVKY